MLSRKESNMRLPKVIETFPIPDAAPLQGRLYVRTAAHLRGPFDVGVLKAMQLRGEILRDTMLSPDRVRWVTAGSLPQLFPVELFASCIPSSEQDMLWHVLIEGQRQGPISWNSLCDLAETGRLRAMDLVTVDGGDNWVRAAAVAGLPVPADSGPGVFSESKKAWMIGAGMATTILAVVPLVLMLIWHEKGIGLSEEQSIRKDTRSHETSLQDDRILSDELTKKIRAESDKEIASIAAKATVEAAELEAIGQGAKIDREEKARQEEIAATKEAAEVNAAAARDAARENAAAVRDAGQENAAAQRERAAADRDIADAIRSRP